MITAACKGCQFLYPDITGRKAIFMILPLAYITAAWGSGVDFDEKCDTYSRALLEAGYYPICPKAHQSIFLHEDNPREHQLGLDMGQHIMGRCRILVVCGNTYDEYVKRTLWRTR